MQPHDEYSIERRASRTTWNALKKALPQRLSSHRYLITCATIDSNGPFYLDLRDYRSWVFKCLSYGRLLEGCWLADWKTSGFLKTYDLPSFVRVPSLLLTDVWFPSGHWQERSYIRLSPFVLSAVIECRLALWSFRIPKATPAFELPHVAYFFFRLQGHRPT
jgi:hypothetical protein